MPLSVRVGPETENLLKRLARKKGLTKSEFVRDAIVTAARLGELSEQVRRPWNDIEDLIGCVKAGPPDLSVGTGLKFRRILLAKRGG